MHDVDGLPRCKRLIDQRAIRPGRPHENVVIIFAQYLRKASDDGHRLQLDYARIGIRSLRERCGEHRDLMPELLKGATLSVHRYLRSAKGPRMKICEKSDMHLRPFREFSRSGSWPPNSSTAHDSPGLPPAQGCQTIAVDVIRPRDRRELRTTPMSLLLHTTARPHNVTGRELYLML
jgi:hypothetical protein